MVGRQDSSAHRVLPGSRAVGEVSQPSLLWVTSLINLPEDKEQRNPLPSRCVTLGYDPDLIPAPAYRRGRALQSRDQSPRPDAPPGTWPVSSGHLVVWVQRGILVPTWPE